MIEIVNLSFSYGREMLFSHLNLSVKSGNICGLLGKNGAGKTTLLKIFSGLLFAQDGECQIMGWQPADRSPGFLQEVVMLPEEFTLPPVTATQYERLYAPLYPRFNSNLFKGLLEEFDLTLNKKLTKYSYGQKKKFFLAFALATDCRFLLLDEPTNGLDIPSKSQFRKAIASSLTDDRLFVISTHQARDLENLIDPVIILDDGQIIFNRSIEEISTCLSVEFLPQRPEPGQALYVEEQLEGFLVVSENSYREESKVDLEVLFNTVIQNREKISVLFAVQGGRQ